MKNSKLIIIALVILAFVAGYFVITRRSPQPIQLTYLNGNVSAKNLQSGQEIVTTSLFWFAWRAFHPDTKLY